LKRKHSFYYIYKLISNAYSVEHNEDDMNICIFAGASPLTEPEYLSLATRTGTVIAKARHLMVFGGGANGMMGAAATGAVQHDGQVIGILPKFLFEREPPHPLVSDMRVVETMHERKTLMYELADAFIALPGGFGTLEETMEIITWRQLSLHSKPLVFLGDHGFWAGVEGTFDAMFRAGFLSPRDRALASFSREPEQALELIIRTHAASQPIRSAVDA
jgi:uncharacterized protein (TIGR00730 family)